MSRSKLYPDSRVLSYPPSAKMPLDKSRNNTASRERSEERMLLRGSCDSSRFLLACVRREAAPGPRQPASQPTASETPLNNSQQHSDVPDALYTAVLDGPRSFRSLRPGTRWSFVNIMDEKYLVNSPSLSSPRYLPSLPLLDATSQPCLPRKRDLHG